jgi:Cu/Ag efflux protein CusF
MKRILLPAVLVASVGLSGLAMAAPATTMGTIKSIDAAAKTLTLNDGTLYGLPTGFDLSKLKVGEKVSVVWEMAGGKHAANSVTPAS